MSRNKGTDSVNVIIKLQRSLMEVYSMNNTQFDWENCVLSLITLLLCIVLSGAH